MNIKDVIMGGGILPAMYKEYEAKQDAKDAEMEELKKAAAAKTALATAATGEAPGNVLNKKKGGVVKASSASRRADGMASRGKTRGKMC